MANLHAHIPEGLLPKDADAYIAGGYAACPELASDIDVWVKGDSFDDLGAIRRRVLSHLTAHYYRFEALNDERAHADNYGELLGHVLKIARVKLRGKRDIHILATDMPPVDLLSTFDISTHMVALDGERAYKYPGKTTELHEEPVVNRMTPTTPARLEKIRARYAHLRGTTHGEVSE